ncbi:group I intron-associated PD-(D/E)XK endonuclease [Floridanema aerugineum]|uniref:Group I intron-associated PD-(D/E)XK endonuclease n=1 Tax=Floridaenema aerugineum BLCC-F46 TaxID=3153654 RepID=A0ABV4X465_9CYAN
MIEHHTKVKGDVAVAKAIADLTARGYVVFTPVFSEHLPFDLVVWKDNEFIRIQVKYSSFGKVAGYTCWNDKKGTHQRKYKTGDFECYAIYLPEKDRVIYPSIDYRGVNIRTELPNSPTPFYWWEDFLKLGSKAEKRKLEDFGVKVKIHKAYKARINTRKVERPSKKELEKLVWEKPTTQIAQTFGVSDQAVAKWCKAYKIKKPPRGYWAKKQHGKI